MSGRRVRSDSGSWLQFQHHADITLGRRRAVAAYTGRHEHLITRYCQPVACEARKRGGHPVMLYDVDDCAAKLRGLRQRVA